MLPLYLLNSVKGENVVVELKTGGVVNGTLEKCDTYMNVTLVNAYVLLSPEEQLHKIDQIYIKGTTIKLFKIGNEFIEKFKEQQQKEKESFNRNSHNNRQNNYNKHNRYGNNNRRNNNRNNNYQNNNNNNNNNRSGNRDSVEVRN